MFKTRIALAVAAGALTLPAAASAGSSVQADRLPEGNAGLTEAPSSVGLSCAYRASSCKFEVRFTEGTAKAFADYGFDPPKQVSLRGGRTRTVTMLAEIVGDTVPEPDETLRIKVVETRMLDGDRTRRVKHFTGPTIVNDDGPRRYIPNIGKHKPVHAPEDRVGRWDWNDGTSVGWNCVTDDARGVKGAFGARDYYIPGCVTTRVDCPPGRKCIGHAKSTITSSAADAVTLNQRVRVSVGNGTPPWHRDGSCAGTVKCESAIDTILINGGGSATLECNGTHARADAVASVECNLDLEFVK